MNRFLVPAAILAVALTGCDGRTNLHSVVETDRTADANDEARSQVSAGKKSETVTLKSLTPASLPSRTDVAPPRRLRPDDWFEDVSESSGVRFTYHNGCEAGFYTLLETVGGGVAMFDFDRDGDLDLFFTGGGRMTGPPIEVHGRRAALFRNDGDWQFTEVTEQTGLADDTLYTHGCAVGDFDNDGWPDLFVAGYRGCRLYRNVDGSRSERPAQEHAAQEPTSQTTEHNGRRRDAVGIVRRFEDITSASGLSVSTDWNVTGCWADFDNDGLLDLYVVTYADWTPEFRRLCPNDRGQRDTCPPTAFAGARDRLWRNSGGGRFEDISRSAGLSATNRGLGVVATDVNADGRIDVYVVSDVQENCLYLGRPALPLRSAGIEAGVAFSPEGQRQGSMGVDAGDVDGDGRPDLWYANFADEDNTLYRNLGDGTFLDATAVAGLAGRSRRWVGFGTALADFDGDGWLDIVLANGHVRYGESNSPYFQPAQLFRGRGDGHFVEVTEQGGPYFSVPHAGRGLAAGDLDNDGDLDLVIVHQNAPVVLLRNRRDAENWVRIELRGTESNRDGVGAKVVADAAGRRSARWAKGGGGYLSHSDRRFSFPLRHDCAVDVTVHWPRGKVETFADLSPDQSHTLIEGRGRSTDP